MLITPEEAAVIIHNMKTEIDSLRVERDTLRIKLERANRDAVENFNAYSSVQEEYDDLKRLYDELIDEYDDLDIKYNRVKDVRPDAESVASLEVRLADALRGGQMWHDRYEDQKEQLEDLRALVREGVSKICDLAEEVSAQTWADI